MSYSKLSVDQLTLIGLHNVKKLFMGHIWPTEIYIVLTLINLTINDTDADDMQTLVMYNKHHYSNGIACNRSNGTIHLM